MVPVYWRNSLSPIRPAFDCRRSASAFKAANLDLTVSRKTVFVDMAASFQRKRAGIADRGSRVAPNTLQKITTTGETTKSGQTARTAVLL
jgi:hypothetical protein